MEDQDIPLDWFGPGERHLHTHPERGHGSCCAAENLLREHRLRLHAQQEGVLLHDAPDKEQA